MYRITYYPRKEEILNVITHFTGFILSLAGLYFLTVKAVKYNDIWLITGFTIFGISMVLLYLASSLYHMSKRRKTREKLNILDHAAIYILIAGTYTPFCLIPLRGVTGWILFATTWALAITGVILKLFFTGKYDFLSTIAYVVMGWIVVFAIKPLINSLSPEALFYLFLGGASYTIGAGFYLWKKLSFNHAILHLFVLGGTFFFFFAV